MAEDGLTRRAFGTLAASAVLASPFSARAQPAERKWRIGLLRVAPPIERDLAALLQGLAEHGYVQGRNFVLVPQWGDGNVARLSELAVTLVNSGVDIIVAEGGIVVGAAAAVTSTIPIVMASTADPFIGGRVKNLARPGGNITGFTSQTVDISGKTMEILKQMVPALTRIAMLSPREVRSMFASAQDEAAKTLGIEMHNIDMPRPEAADAAMRQAVSAGAKAALVRGSPFFSSTQRRMIVDSAAEHRLPVMYERRDYVDQGGLVSYSADFSNQYRRTGDYVAKILAGANPGELPIQQPTKFEFVINLKTAKVLALDLPTTLLARADEVIE